jgi:hypothetical protein
MMPGSAGGRVHYSKVERDCLIFVIVEIHPDGRAEFFSQEAGEVRWFPFVPQPAERRAALALSRPRVPLPAPHWPLLFAEDGME